MIPVDPPPVHRAVTLRRDRIVVYPTRNVRNFGKPIDPEAPETIALAKLIARDGQLKAVTVVLENPDARLPSTRLEDYRYLLDTGFRRMCAMDLLEFSEIKCEVVDAGSETETARIARVIGENEGHKPLTPAELAYACSLLRDVGGKGGEPTTPAQIADKVGRGEFYCKELLYAWDHLIPPIRKAWQGEGAMSLPVTEAFRFAHMGHARQEEAWKGYLSSKSKDEIRGPGARGGKRRGPRACARSELELLRARVSSLTSVHCEGRYVEVPKQQLRIVRAAIKATLAHALNRDAAPPFKGPT